jgi:hypothetical protein
MNVLLWLNMDDKKILLVFLILNLKSTVRRKAGKFILQEQYFEGSNVTSRITVYYCRAGLFENKFDLSKLIFLGGRLVSEIVTPHCRFSLRKNGAALLNHGAAWLS